MKNLLSFIFNKEDIIDGTLIIDFDKITNDNYVEISEDELYEGYMIDPVALSTPIKKIIIMAEGKVQSINIFDYDADDLGELYE